MKIYFRNVLGLMLVILATGLAGGLAGGSVAHAATGSSIPVFTYPVLNIPRIDVEGLGSFNLNLVLVDDASLRFAIGDATPASAALTPGATYNLQTQILNIPMVRIGTDYLDVQMQLVGENFQVTAAAAAIVTGQASYNQLCASCHGTDGLGGALNIPLKNCSNCATLELLTQKISSTMPLGNPTACTGTCASDTASYILNVINSSSSGQSGLALEAITAMPLDATLRNASLQLVSRLPTDAEAALVASQGETGLRQALDGMMEQDAFYDTLQVIFNDVLHTNRYLSPNGAEQAVLLLRRYSTARWYDPGTDLRGTDYDFNRITTNDSVATEPLELINYVVKNNKPMTEILTANYFMVNGYSAKSYNIQGLGFKDEWDADEFLPAMLPNQPHAGILSSMMFLNRYPTSDTNRNRGRSRVVYDLFLDVDILALDGARPDGSAVDISSSSPTLDNPDCLKCHSLLDPVASAFQNWNLGGSFVSNRAWYTDMLQAGFDSLSYPSSSTDDELQWLADQITADPRFDDGIMRIVYFGLTGHDPLDPPSEGATTAETDAYLAESARLDEIKQLYVANNRNLKTMIKEIILSPYWRADSLNDEGYALVHEETGAARLLSPESLHAKIEALFGFQWRGPLDQYSTNVNNANTARLLDKRLYYQQLYGGIDSFTITERLTDPNGLMVIVQERMANEMACYSVPNEFLAQASQRRLLPYVETSTVLTSSAGQAAVRQNIQHLHQHLLGEELALTDAEIEFTYTLFASVLQTGQSAVLAKTEATTLPTRCMRNNDMTTGTSLNVSGGVDGRLRTDSNYTIRAWMAVVAYLLSDYRFTYF